MSKLPFRSPRRLCMIKLECDYCGDKESIETKDVGYLLGILHCKSHRKEAEQDCWWYMKEKNLIHVARHRLPNSLLEYRFRVSRSNGSVDEGWRFALDKADYEFPSFTLFSKRNGDWCVPLWHPEDMIMKSIPSEQVKGLNAEILDDLNTFLTFLGASHSAALNYEDLFLK